MITVPGPTFPRSPTWSGWWSGCGSDLRWADATAEAPEGRRPVCFTPKALPALLLPVQLACIGKTVLQGSSPLAGRIGEHRFDSAFSLVDDPLADGRSGSRPVDDEGVVSRRFPLVEAGVDLRFHLRRGERHPRQASRPTGHGRRTTFGKPQPAYTNLVVSPGSARLRGAARPGRRRAAGGRAAGRRPGQRDRRGILPSGGAGLAGDQGRGRRPGDRDPGGRQRARPARPSAGCRRASSSGGAARRHRRWWWTAWRWWGGRCDGER